MPEVGRAHLCSHTNTDNIEIHRDQHRNEISNCFLVWLAVLLIPWIKPKGQGPKVMPSPMKPGELPDVSAQFTTTHWSVVLAAGDANSIHAASALETLCRRYWYPLYAYVRRSGRSPEDAQDITQSFFARILTNGYLQSAVPDKGRFRSFLLTSLNHFLADHWRHAHRQKRGAGQALIPLDEASAEERYRIEPVDRLDAEKIYERRWALTLLEGVLDRLAVECTAAGKSDQFEQMRPFLIGDRSAGGYAQTASRLGMTEGALRVAVHRMRRRYQELFRAEIANTVESSDQIEGEINHVFAVLS